MNELINQIKCGDCIEILNGVKEPFADLIFADPPFNIGYKYDKYNDKQKKEHYLDWTRKWMSACVNVLKPAGSFYIAIGDAYAANIKVIADELGFSHATGSSGTILSVSRQKINSRFHTHIFFIS
jgi:site-specific DNA-methyltransferase (adenine-specific)